MNIQSKINKLLQAIRLKGIEIKKDTIQCYSEETNNYFNVYNIYTKEWKRNKYGERVKRWVLQDEFTSKIKLLKYLANKYKKIREGEADGK